MDAILILSAWLAGIIIIICSIIKFLWKKNFLILKTPTRLKFLKFDFMWVLIIGACLNVFVVMVNDWKMPIIKEAYEISQNYGWSIVRGGEIWGNDRYTLKTWREARFSILCDFIYIPYLSFSINSLGDWLMFSFFIVFWLRYLSLLKAEKIKKNK